MEQRVAVANHLTAARVLKHRDGARRTQARQHWSRALAGAAARGGKPHAAVGMARCGRQAFLETNQ